MDKNVTQDGIQGNHLPLCLFTVSLPSYTCLPLHQTELLCIKSEFEIESLKFAFINGRHLQSHCKRLEMIMYNRISVSYHCKTQQRLWVKSLNERLLQWVEKLTVNKNSYLAEAIRLATNWATHKVPHISSSEPNNYRERKDTKYIILLNTWMTDHLTQLIMYQLACVYGTA